MTSFLVTGGFGFIGSTLVAQLLSDPETRVHVVDDLSTSSLDIDDYRAVLGAAASRLTYDIASVHDYLAGHVPAFDGVYHLASPVGPVGVLKYAGRMVQEVVRDCYALIDLCLERGMPFLDVSTSEVYGGGQNGLCSESSPKIVPAETTIRLEYAIAKLAAETAIINTVRTTPLKAVIVRPFNVAGPRQSPKGGFVLPRFIQQADAGLPLTVFGDGSALRAFTHVADMASGIILAMRRGELGVAYNIGNPANRTSILELAKMVVRELGSSSEIQFVDPKTLFGPLYAEASDKFPDASLAMREIGWEPQHDIPSTIRDAFVEYRRQRDAGVLSHRV
jgi:nucleoside-diphosphate-sugar epimerase